VTRSESRHRKRNHPIPIQSATATQKIWINAGTEGRKEGRREGRTNLTGGGIAITPAEHVTEGLEVCGGVLRLHSSQHVVNYSV
jgi:hypothetical protein